MRKGRGESPSLQADGADFGPLYCTLCAIRDAPDPEFDMLVTGTHLSPGFGMTVREIEEAGFPIGPRIEVMLSSDSGVGTAKARGGWTCFWCRSEVEKDDQFSGSTTV